MAISNLVSDELHTLSWKSHNHPHWCFVLKPQHCRLLTLRWDSSFPTILTLANVQPPENTEHTSTEHLRVAKLQLLFQQTILDEIYFCFLYCDQISWVLYMGISMPRSCSQDEAITLLPSQRLLQKTHFLYFLCLHVYTTWCFSPLQNEFSFKIYLSWCPLSVGHWEMSPLCSLNKSSFRGLKIHHY